MLSVFSSFYAGNLLYYSLILKSNNIIIDLFENFQKQSFRNRCIIASPNGSLNLIIPITRNSNRLVKEIKIDNSQSWRKRHWKSLESSYRSSPYFEFYENEFHDLYYKDNSKFLFDFNNLINLKILKILEIEKKIVYSSSYVINNEKMNDYRILIHPKLKTKTNLIYNQVFQEKNNFISNLSILDLIFNEGPMARQFLFQLSSYKN